MHGKTYFCVYHKYMFFLRKRNCIYPAFFVAYLNVISKILLHVICWVVQKMMLKPTNFFQVQNICPNYGRLQISIVCESIVILLYYIDNLHKFLFLLFETRFYAFTLFSCKQVMKCDKKVSHLLKLHLQVNLNHYLYIPCIFCLLFLIYLIRSLFSLSHKQ